MLPRGVGRKDVKREGAFIYIHFVSRGACAELDSVLVSRFTKFALNKTLRILSLDDV